MPTPFQRILFCTDFSHHADQAFTAAVDQACRLDPPTFHLLHILPEPEAQFWKTYLSDQDDVDHKALRDVTEKIESSYRRRLPEGMTMSVTIRGGSPDGETLSFAQEIDADLIVLGRRGHSSLGKVLFGDIADKIVRRATCAVLVTP